VPERIQLRRTKGWRKPEGAVVVARPTPWGNPYRMGEPAYGNEPVTAAEVVEMFRLHLDVFANVGPDGADPFAPLRGRDLACWCPLDQPCHADVLLDVANGPS